MLASNTYSACMGRVRPLPPGSEAICQLLRKTPCNTQKGGCSQPRYAIQDSLDHLTHVPRCNVHKTTEGKTQSNPLMATMPTIHAVRHCTGRHTVKRPPLCPQVSQRYPTITTRSTMSVARNKCTRQGKANSHRPHPCPSHANRCTDAQPQPPSCCKASLDQPCTGRVSPKRRTNGLLLPVMPTEALATASAQTRTIQAASPPVTPPPYD